MMKNCLRTVAYDKEYRVEACRFAGMVQPFPNHFHEYYVIGAIESGKRRLSCNHSQYSIGKGTIVLFQPGDIHGCAQNGDEAFSYRGLNLSQDDMIDFTEKITGKRELPNFSKNVVEDKNLYGCLRLLHEMVLCGARGLQKEETLVLFLSALLQKCGQSGRQTRVDCRQEVEKACDFIQQHSAERIGLDEISRFAGLSTSTLLRAFTKEKGVTPYRYLEAVRINRAKALLQRGVPPIDVAAQTGFSDQSHFTHYFSRWIGVTPGAYRAIFFDENGE